MNRATEAGVNTCPNCRRTAGSKSLATLKRRLSIPVNEFSLRQSVMTWNLPCRAVDITSRRLRCRQDPWLLHPSSSCVFRCTRTDFLRKDRIDRPPGWCVASKLGFDATPTAALGDREACVLASARLLHRPQDGRETHFDPLAPERIACRRSRRSATGGCSSNLKRTPGWGASKGRPWSVKNRASSPPCPSEAA